MATPLGGTFSLTGGMDLSPVKVRQDQQRLNLAARAAFTGEKQAERGLDLEERKMAQDESRFEREMNFRQTESAATRAQEEYLTRLQHAGRVDLQELLIAAQASQQATAIKAENLARTETFEFQRKQFEEKLSLDATQFDTRIRQENEQFGEKIRLEIARGRREDARLSIDERIAELSMYKTQRELDNLPSPEEARATRGLDFEIAKLSLEKIAMEMEDQRAAQPVLQMLREAQLRLTQMQATGTDPQSELTRAQTAGVMAGAEESLARAEQTRFETSAGRKVLSEKEEGKAPEEKMSAEIGALRELSRQAEKGKLGTVGKARMRALTELKDMKDFSDPISEERKEKLRAFDALARGLEGEDVSDLSVDGWDAALGLLGPITLGATWQALLVKKGIEGLGRLTEDEKKTMIREMSEELDLSE